MYRSSPKRISNALHYFTAAAAGAPLLILAFAISSGGQEKSPVAIPNTNPVSVTIKNFGQMNEHFYRGAQPKDYEYKELAGLGVKTIIDLRDDPMPFAKSAAEASQIRYLNIPMSDSDYPKQEAIDQFLKTTSDPSNWPFYVHCAGGRHRTGLMGAVYRFNQDGWDYQKAYQEMKKYDYYSRWGHSEIKKYVKLYWQRMNTPNSDTVSVHTNK